MTKCNGWTNRETWLVSLWFGDTLAALQDDGIEITPALIRAEVEDYVDEVLRGQSGFIIDMLDLGAIDYEELAAAYTEA